MCHNARSLRTAALKLYYTNLLRMEPRPDVLLLNETWEIGKNEITFFLKFGYLLVVANVRPGRGGGVCIFARRHTLQYAVIPLTLPQNSLMEACACWIGPRGASPAEFIAMASVYVPPIGAVGTEPEAWLEDTIAYMNSMGIELIAGDMNARHCSWCPTLSRISEKYLPATDPRNRGARLYALSTTSSWKVANTREITRRTDEEGKENGSAPDVVLHQNRLRCEFSVVRSMKEADRGAASDHYPIRLTIRDRFYHMYALKERCTQVAWRAIHDWDAVRRHQDEVLRGARKIAPRESGYTHYQCLALVMTETLGMLPRVSRQARCTSIRLPPELEQLRMEVNAEYERTSMDRKLDLIRQYRRDIKKYWDENEIREWDAITSARERNADWTRAVWRKYNNTARPPPPALTNKETGRPLKPRIQAKLFAQCFEQKYVESATVEARDYVVELRAALQVLRDHPSLQTSPVDDCVITMAEVQSAIAAMNVNQAGDTWGLKPILLTNVSTNTLALMASTFSALLRDAQMPKEWLRADVVPLYKGEPKDPSELKSYRPVAITNLLCRVFESVMATRILLHLRTLPHSGLHPRQFGFRRGVSTDMAMGCMLNDLITSASYRMYWQPPAQRTARSYSRMLVAVDFTDAFCRVTPDKIEWALRRRGLPEPVCTWARAYLTHRTQRVFVNGRFSPSFSCPIGCPQGSIIGPLFWNLAMDDLLESLETFCADAAAVVFVAPRKAGTVVSRKKRAATAPDADAVVQGRRTHLRDAIMTAAREAAVCPEEGSPPYTWDAEPLPRQIVEGPLCGFAAYADDLTIWVASHSPRYTAGTTQCMLNHISLWARRNGIAVSTKTEGRWITDALRQPSLQPMERVVLSVGEGAQIFIPKIVCGETKVATPTLRILGLQVDQRLTFQAHAEEVRRKVDAVLVDASRRLPFMPPSVRYMVLQAMITPHILQFTPIYWAAAGSRTKRYLRTAWNQMCKAITCTMLTTRNIAAIQEAGLRPLGYHVRKARLNLQRRVWALPDDYRFLWALPVGLEDSSENRVRGLGRILSRKDGRLKAAWRHYLPPPPQSRQRREFRGYGQTPVSALSSGALRSVFLTQLSVNGQRLPAKALGEQRQFRQFNATQLATSATSKIELWTDGSVEPNVQSGGAFIIVKDGVEILRGSTTLGDAACSYSMERAALVCGLRALTTLALANGWEECPVRVVTDSLSCLSELQRGPFRQEEEQMEEIWQLLSQLRVPRIFLVFVFSHMEDHEGQAADTAMRWNTLVDHLAEQAQASTTEVPQWPRDLIRPLISQLTARTDDSFRARSTLRYEALQNGRPSTDIQKMHFPRSQQKFLMQLRCGAARKLPGWRTGAPEKCPHCTAKVGRESTSAREPTLNYESVVIHLFYCPGWPTALTLASLWNSPVEALRHANAYIGHPEDTPDGDSPAD